MGYSQSMSSSAVTPHPDTNETMYVVVCSRCRGIKDSRHMVNIELLRRCGKPLDFVIILCTSPGNRVLVVVVGSGSATDHYCYGYSYYHVDRTAGVVVVIVVVLDVDLMPSHGSSSIQYYRRHLCPCR